MTPGLNALQARLATLPPHPPRGTVLAYRTVPLLALRKYSSDPLNTAGSLFTGGRFNTPEGLPGAHAALYVSEHLATAQAEAGAITAVTGPGGLHITPGPDQRPRLDITVQLRLREVLDLTDPETLAHLHLTTPDLLGDWLSANLRGEVAVPQHLARAALNLHRFDAIRAPSARYPGGVNYAVFPDRVDPTDRRTLDPDDELRVFRAALPPS